ncbi:MAG: putative site-specific recombinase [Bradyrhizobium sp.]|nr:putative site-specific recombinase [Bradyrhizobium sp.]
MVHSYRTIRRMRYGSSLAKRLNARNVPAFGPSAKWDQSTIHNLLSNRATVGEHQPKQYRNRKAFAVGDPIPNYYPAVIEESLFQAAQVSIGVQILQAE